MKGISMGAAGANAQLLASLIQKLRAKGVLSEADCADIFEDAMSGIKKTYAEGASGSALEELTELREGTL